MWKPWCLAALFVAALGACTLPGHSGWECDNNSDCSSGLECRSVHGERSGYTTVCLAPGETVVVGGKGNWPKFLMWPAIGLCVAAGLIRLLVRKLRPEDEVGPRRRRRRR